MLTAATEEARRRGDRRLGTDHLLLGLLHGKDSPAARALGADLAAARAASDALDLAALAAVGVNVARLGEPSQPVHARGHLSLTSGARAVFVHAVEQARGARTPRIETRHFLLALLDRERPDPAAELLRASASILHRCADDWTGPANDHARTQTSQSRSGGLATAAGQLKGGRPMCRMPYVCR